MFDIISMEVRIHPWQRNWPETSLASVLPGLGNLKTKHLIIEANTVHESVDTTLELELTISFNPNNGIRF